MSEKRLVRVPKAGHRLPPSGTDFVEIEVVSGIVLALATVAALVWANVATAGYDDFWHRTLSLGIGDLSIEEDLRHWVNDGLMTIFFFVVGLEIKREVHGGELRDLRRAALPIAAALGGMAMPAILYLAAVAGTPEATAGWGVPMATDIAFAVGILALLGPRVPAALRVLLLALAIIDDLGAILVIALFYSSGISLTGLLVALAGVFAIRVFQWFAIRSPWLYVLPGTVVWAGILLAGVHPTIAGVIVGLRTPMTPWYGRRGFVATARRALAEAETKPDDSETFRKALTEMEAARREAKSPGERIEHALHPWVAFGVMPIFALANAGVALDTLRWDAPGAVPLFAGILLGLAVGKPVGVWLASSLAVRLRLAVLPAGVDGRGLWVVGAVSGVGFTMSLFIGSLAFPEGVGLDVARFAVLVASALAAVVGLVLGRVLLRAPAAPPPRGPEPGTG